MTVFVFRIIRTYLCKSSEKNKLTVFWICYREISFVCQNLKTYFYDLMVSINFGNSFLVFTINAHIIIYMYNVIIKV